MRGAGDDERHDRGHGQPDQQHDDVGVQLADEGRVQTGTPGVRVTRVRAAAGDDGAQDEHRTGDGDQAADQPAQRRCHQRPARCVTLAGAHKERHRRGDDGHREAEVRGDQPRVQVGEHGEPAQHRLGDDAQHQRSRPTQQRPATRAAAQHGQHRHDDHRRERKGQHPVGELDQTVQAMDTGHDVATVTALRPGGAAQSRAGQPHQGAGHHDHRIGDHRGQRRPGDGTRGDPDPAHDAMVGAGSGRTWARHARGPAGTVGLRAVSVHRESWRVARARTRSLSDSPSPRRCDDRVPPSAHLRLTPSGR